MRIAEIPDSWKPFTLFPSSIPHLLHWDLAYLWILMKDPVYQPDSWTKRIETWRRLLALFLAGRLEVEEDPIPKPMIDFTAPYGIRKLQRLVWKQGEDRITIGVVSPVVVVRPLPDLAIELKVFPEDGALVRQVLSRLIDELDTLLETGDGANRAVQADLQKLLTRERDALPSGTPQPHALQPIPCSFLRAIDFHRVAAPPHPAAVDPMEVYVVNRGVTGERQFVPRCATCKKLLTRSRSAPAVRVTGDHVDLPCPEGHPNRILLEKLFIWYRPRVNQTPEYVVWRDRRGEFAVPDSEPEWPPQADGLEAGGSEVVFEWNPGALLGDSRSTTLRLRFEDGNTRPERVKTGLFYEKLLIPCDDAVAFQGLPIRYDWRDAWQGAQQINRANNQIEFRAIGVAGVPFRFTRTYSVNMQRDAAVAVGLYPPPMHSQWKAYRAVAVGPASANYRMRAEGDPVLPTVVDTHGWPEWVAVETPDQRIGVSFPLKDQTPPPAEDAVSRVRVGIDFGTSNTVVYFRVEKDTKLQTSTHAIHPAQFRELVHWLHMPPHAAFDYGWFLPTTAQPDQDVCLFPSALWLPQEGKPLLRWSAPPPIQCGTSFAFKWDDRLQDRHEHRIRYLREVFFYSVPALLRSLGNPKARAQFDICFSYPLAFSFDQRNDHFRLIEAASRSLAELSGHTVRTHSINESLAAVCALGDANPRTLYLVADMGGRTLDVALFRVPGKPSDILQIGSLDFGGELFLRRLAERQTGTNEGPLFLDAYWELRNRIQAGTAAKSYGGDLATSEVMDRLHTLALEFLRTMAEALAVNQPGNRGEEIRLMLIGNGWRLRDLRAAGLDPNSFFCDFSNRTVAKMGVPGLVSDDSVVPGVRFSKHLVAIGALKAAESGQAHELGPGKPPYPTRLPLGRGIEVEQQSRSWHEYTGSDGFPFTSTAQAINGPINFALEQDRPPVPSTWEPVLQGLHLEHGWYPQENQLREWVKKSIENDRLLKGPLQLILDNHWSLSL